MKSKALFLLRLEVGGLFFIVVDLPFICFLLFSLSMEHKDCVFVGERETLGGQVPYSRGHLGRLVLACGATTEGHCQPGSPN